MIDNVMIKERGWPAHFCAAASCRYVRNTHVIKGTRFIVVSSVGNYRNREERIDKIGSDRYYETMVFIGCMEDQYPEADISREVTPDMPRGIYGASVDELSEFADNDMDTIHDNMINHVATNFEELYQEQSDG